MKHLDCDAAIVGGGAVGAALALALRRAGLRVHLIERGAGPRPWNAADYDLRVYALAPASAAFLQELGVWDSIASRRISPYRAMRVWDDLPAQALAFDAADIRAPQLGHIVENDLLMDTLWQALVGVTLHLKTEVEAFSAGADGALLTLSGGKQISAALVIAADGADSRLRTLAGIDTAGWDYPQTALVAHVVTEKPHRETAWQRFLPSGPLAFLPLADGRSSIVWSSTQAAELLALDDASFRARLGEALQFELGEIRECTRRLSFPLRLLHAANYVSERLALAGDAAHVVHPLAGQGVNLGLADAQLLAQLLIAALDVGRDLGNARLLARYERVRQADNLDMLVVTDGLYRAFGARGGSWDSLRLIGMGAVNRLAPLKNLLVRRAVGA